MVKDLGLYPYRIQIKHQQTETEMEKKVAVSQKFLKKIDNNKKFLNDVWFLDKTYFLLNRNTNFENLVFWKMMTLTQSLEAFCIQKSAWPTISKDGIIGTFFYKNDHNNVVTVRKERYVPVLEQFWGELEKSEDLDEKEQRLQQHDAHPHTP